MKFPKKKNARKSIVYARATCHRHAAAAERGIAGKVETCAER